MAAFWLFWDTEMVGVTLRKIAIKYIEKLEKDSEEQNKTCKQNISG